MAPIDLLGLAMFIGMMALEGNRGIIPALMDFLCVLGTGIAGHLLYTPLAQYVGRSSTSFLIIVAVMLALTAILSIFVSRRLKVHVTALEATIGAVLGLLSAGVFCYILFEWLSIYYGSNAAILKDSVLAWQLHEFAGIHALMDFVRTLQGR